MQSGIEQLYQDLRRPILAYLTRIVGDRETAEDLCQETFLKALCGWGQRHSPAGAASWLYRIAANTAYDYLRRQRRVRFTSLQSAEAVSSSGRSIETRLCEDEPVQVTLTHLPQRYRMLLLLYGCVGCSMHEIAALLGCSSDAVKMRLNRARRHFRRTYTALLEAPGG